MFGMPITKLGGMRHVWYYYTQNWEAPDHAPPKLLKPYSHEACKACHPPDRAHQPLEHQVHREAIMSNEVGCTAAGCHGRPHPVNPKAAREAASEAAAATAHDAGARRPPAPPARRRREPHHRRSRSSSARASRATWRSPRWGSSSGRWCSRRRCRSSARCPSGSSSARSRWRSSSTPSPPTCARRWRGCACEPPRRPLRTDPSSRPTRRTSAGEVIAAPDGAPSSRRHLPAVASPGSEVSSA